MPPVRQISADGGVSKDMEYRTWYRKYLQLEDHPEAIQDYLNAIYTGLGKIPPDRIAKALIETAERENLAEQHHPMINVRQPVAPFSPKDSELVDRMALFQLLDKTHPFTVTPQAHQIEHAPKLGQEAPLWAVGPHVTDQPLASQGLINRGQTLGPVRETADFDLFTDYGQALEASEAPFSRENMMDALGKALLDHYLTTED